MVATRMDRIGMRIGHRACLHMQYADLSPHLLMLFRGTTVISTLRKAHSHSYPHVAQTAEGV